MAEQLAFGAQAGDRGAVVSPNGAYRYHLWRTISSEPRRVAFVMLNPSTADAMLDDPTIRKCRGFTERWGYGRFDVVNLFAYRATKPKTLETAWHNGQDIVGPHNGEWIAKVVESSSLVVFAWGASLPRVGHLEKRVIQSVIEIAGPTSNTIGSPSRSVGRPVMCLGRTDGGQPRHPLMLAYSTPLEPFEVRRG